RSHRAQGPPFARSQRHAGSRSRHLVPSGGESPHSSRQAEPRSVPRDFMFKLTASETASLRSQIVISNSGRGGRRTAPYAFTEQGVAMLSSVLRSPRAVRVNIEIMRAFVRLRQLLDANIQLARKLDDLERKCDARFVAVFEAIDHLTAAAPSRKKRRIGF